MSRTLDAVLSVAAGDSAGAGASGVTIAAPNVTVRGLVVNRWAGYGIYLNGKKIGYSKVSRTRSDDTIVDFFDMSMKLASFGKKVEMKMTRTLTFAEPGAKRSAGRTRRAGPGRAW